MAQKHGTCIAMFKPKIPPNGLIPKVRRPLLLSVYSPDRWLEISPRMNPLLRAASKADVTPIQAIYAHHVLHGTGTFETEPPDLAEMSRRHAAITEAGLPYFVAEYDGMIVGYGYAGPFRPRAAYRYTLEDSIYLHPDWTGQGVGRQLLDRLMAESAHRGFKQMIAVIGDSDNRASVRLHTGAGFTETGTLRNVGYKFDRWLDVVIMQRAL